MRCEQGNLIKVCGMTALDEGDVDGWIIMKQKCGIRK
jgi:hypothetical protein